MASYVPHTAVEIESMLGDLGMSSVEDLFAAVPDALRLAGGLDVAPGLSEPDVRVRAESRAGTNLASGRDLVCFAGGGAYDHDIPSVVQALAFRSEFVTAYTPYQPEVAQGVLQALFEYQTLLCRLTGMDVANASLYDGASALVEAVNLAVAATGRHTVWISRGVHPQWRAVLATMAVGSGHHVVEVDLDGGATAWPAVDDTHMPAALVLAQPNYLGCLESLAAAAKRAHDNGALLVVAADPVAAGLLSTPGADGADVVIGEGQPFGTPLAFGGPYLGLFACKREYVRRLPGRLVGETVDSYGRRAYVTTLRTREQDIRRDRASSNVCTNQTLVAVAFAVHLAWLGTAGLRELAVRCARATRYTREGLLGIEGIHPHSPAPVLREFAVSLPVPADVACARMLDEGFLAGIPLGSEFGGGLLVAVTEKRTRAEVDAYVAAMAKAVRP